MAEPNDKSKRGPKAERLKIEGDPQEALRKLLTKPLPEKGEDEGGNSEGSEAPEDRR